MTIPMWVLLAFAVWTLLLLAGTVGVYRWQRILSRRASIADFADYRIEGAGWYERALRAHANCVENLPVYGAIAVVALVAGLDNRLLDTMAVVFMAARVAHSIVHVALAQESKVVFLRSMLFNVQWMCMIGMAATVALSA